MHPATGVHNLAAGCTHFGTCAPSECTIFQSISIHYIGMFTRKNHRVHDHVSFCTRCVHKIYAEIRTLHLSEGFSSFSLSMRFFIFLTKSCLEICIKDINIAKRGNLGCKILPFPSNRKLKQNLKMSRLQLLKLMSQSESST